MAVILQVDFPSQGPFGELLNQLNASTYTSVTITEICHIGVKYDLCKRSIKLGAFRYI